MPCLEPPKDHPPPSPFLSPFCSLEHRRSLEGTSHIGLFFEVTFALEGEDSKRGAMVLAVVGKMGKNAVAVLFGDVGFHSEVSTVRPLQALPVSPLSFFMWRGGYLGVNFLLFPIASVDKDGDFAFHFGLPCYVQCPAVSTELR